ncbi:MAG: GNAT family N-acetyltransferase [Candidatus Obscuribacterales bacterium]|jgi:GNAT superfamily N-acetyltransferase
METKALNPSHLGEIEALVRVAFAKHIGIPDPSSFESGASFASRFEVAADGAFGTFIDDKLVAAIFCTGWGSFGFFGPLVVLPEYWGSGLAQTLIKKADQFFEEKQVELAGLYTFSNSPKHLALYQKFGYWPKQLTALMSAVVSTQDATAERQSTRFSQLDAAAQSSSLAAAKQLCNGIYKGLDLSSEIKALATCKIGDTIFIEKDGGIVGFAVCHYGHGSEATSNNCYLKFAAASDQEQFSRLLTECLKLSSEVGTTHMFAGVNTARHEAYKTMLGSGFKMQAIGVAMLRAQHNGFNRPGVFVIDDWR